MGTKQNHPRKPTALKVLHGEQRRERLNSGEVIPPDDDSTKAPWGMDTEARKVWDYLAPQLSDKRLYTSWDQYALEGFCNAVAMHRKAARALFKEGLIIKGPNGRVKNPLMQVVLSAQKNIKMFAQEFGLTPSARAGITLPEGQAGDEDLAYLLS